MPTCFSISWPALWKDLHVLGSFREILSERRARGAAAGAFTCYDVTTAFAVVRAAEAHGVPVIVLVSEASFRAETGKALVAGLRAVADDANVPVAVQLDHVDDLDLVLSAATSGIGAVMADGSRWPIEQNVAFSCATRAVVGPDVGVEVELGHIEGGEDVASAVSAGALTDPDEAEDLIARVAPDCLAVSIGNVHGTYAQPPRLDWERLISIRERTGDMPLSLHGASGLPDADVRRAVELGVCKVNVNTELRARYLGELEQRLPAVRVGSDVLSLQDALVAALADTVASKLDLFSA